MGWMVIEALTPVKRVVPEEKSRGARVCGGRVWLARVRASRAKRVEQENASGTGLPAGEPMSLRV